MLHSQNLSTVLKQGLTPAQILNSPAISPSSISLLSPVGQPLCSVFAESDDNNYTVITSHNEELSGNTSTVNEDVSLKLIENLKIYSLVLYNNFNQESNWEILELDNEKYISLNKVEIQDGFLVLMMICDNRFPKKLSQKRLQALSEVLKEGLTGYKFE